MSLLRNTIQALTEYKQDGKALALFMGALLLLYGLQYYRKYKDMFAYSLIVGALVLNPLTGALLWKYFSYFYEYSYVYLLLPFAIIIALVVALLYEKVEKKGKRGWIYVALGAVLFVLCGSFSTQENLMTTAREERQIIQTLPQTTTGRPIKLWAPQKYMTVARVYRGDVRLLYGRNLWEPQMGYFIQDVPTDEQIKCYQYMSLLEDMEGLVGEMVLQESTKKDQISNQLEETLQCALDQGVTHIILPSHEGIDIIPILNQVIDHTGYHMVPIGKDYLVYE